MMSLVLLVECCKSGRGFPPVCLSALCVIGSKEKGIFFLGGGGGGAGVIIFISNVFNSAFILKLPVE